MTRPPAKPFPLASWIVTLYARSKTHKKVIFHSVAVRNEVTTGGEQYFDGSPTRFTHIRYYGRTPGPS
jgi:hypothetical protein